MSENEESEPDAHPRPRPHRRPSPLPKASPRHATAHRDRLRFSRGVKVAIIGGLAVFIAAAAAAAASGSHNPRAEQAAEAAQAVRGTAGNGVMSLIPLASSTPAAGLPAAQAVGTRAPGPRNTDPAPANQQVISGLAANGIPKVALNAYRVAAARMASVDPSCGIQWWLLAAIGREESDHGQFGGAVLHPNGTTTPKIIGPALTGNGNQYIPAPANGAALDGDSVYTHALGPMQFIPQTWATYGVDGNGDGVADIFNIYDAALSAGRYLCAAGGDLRTLAGQQTAILAYNHSSVYLAQVLALANAYRTGVPVSGVPVGQTTGALPPIVQTGPPPAVNPGPPTAVGGRARAKQGKHSTHRRHHRSGGGSGGGTGSGGRHHTRHVRHPGGHSSSPVPGPRSTTPGVPSPSKTKLPTKPPTTLPTTSLPTKLPLPSKTATHKHHHRRSPSPGPSSSTCVVNLAGVCV